MTYNKQFQVLAGNEHPDAGEIRDSIKTAASVTVACILDHVNGVLTVYDSVDGLGTLTVQQQTAVTSAVRALPQYLGDLA